MACAADPVRYVSAVQSGTASEWTPAFSLPASMKTTDYVFMWAIADDTAGVSALEPGLDTFTPSWGSHLFYYVREGLTRPDPSRAFIKYIVGWGLWDPTAVGYNFTIKIGDTTEPVRQFWAGVLVFKGLSLPQFFDRDIVNRTTAGSDPATRPAWAANFNAGCYTHPFFTFVQDGDAASTDPSVTFDAALEAPDLYDSTVVQASSGTNLRIIWGYDRYEGPNPPTPVHGFTNPISTAHASGLLGISGRFLPLPGNTADTAILEAEAMVGTPLARLDIQELPYQLTSDMYDPDLIPPDEISPIGGR